MSETITRAEVIKRIGPALQEEQRAFQEESAAMMEGFEGNPWAVLGEIQARTDLESTFFNPQFPLSSALLNRLGVGDDELLTPDLAGTVIDELLDDRAVRLKAVTEGTLDPQKIDTYRDKLSKALKAALVD